MQTFIRLRLLCPRRACTVWMFGFHRRLVRRCECDTDFPKPGPFAHTSQTAATQNTPRDPLDADGTDPRARAPPYPTPIAGPSGGRTDLPTRSHRERWVRDENVVAVVGMDAPLVDAVGGGTAKALLAELGMRSVGDLLRHYPRRYVENAHVEVDPDASAAPTGAAPRSLRVGEHITMLGVVERISGRSMKNRRGHITELEVLAGTTRFVVVFFNQSWRVRRLPVGTRALFSGELAVRKDKWQLTVPACQPIEDPDEPDPLDRLPKLIPIYPATRKVQSWAIMNAVRRALDVLDDPLDPVPEEVLARHGLADLPTALRDVHRADSRAAADAARRRLVWDEAFGLQLALHARRAGSTTRPAAPCPRRADGIAAAFDRRLPFRLTGAQREVGESLAVALEHTEPLNRLLQGDVGSGKTVVALRAMLQVVDAGRQAVLLAPTEVLAAQHARSLRSMLGPLAEAGELGTGQPGPGELDADPDADPDPDPDPDPDARVATRVTLLTGSLGASARRRALLDAQSGVAGIVVGTHAVIQQGVGFADLGLVVVDEQHRFGVEQRDELRSRPGPTTPHVLVMTATPIPRTVAMTLYGDLDTSVLSELPAGRAPIATRTVPTVRGPRWSARVWERVQEEVADAHQVFVVCPRIGEDEEEPTSEGTEPDGPAGPAAADGGADRPPLGVVAVAAELAAGPLAGVRLEVLHGRMPAEDKDAVMRRFAAGAVDVLVATTVVEVGVDVGNATLMVVLDAERFGVSQLHQLRGRVGRGGAPSTCLLVTDAPADSRAIERLDAIAATSDGFAVADLDLSWRREGDVLGTEQSGRRSALQLLSVLRHGREIAEARDAARAVLADDPTLARHPRLPGLVRSVVSEEASAFLDRL